MSLYTHGEGTGPCAWVGCAESTPTHTSYLKPSLVLENKDNRELQGPYTRISNDDLEIINQIYNNCYHNKPKDAQAADWCAQAFRTIRQMRCNAGTNADKCACIQSLVNDPSIPADIKAPYLAELRALCPAYTERFPAVDQLPVWFWVSGAILLYLLATMKR